MERFDTVILLSEAMAHGIGSTKVYTIYPGMVGHIIDQFDDGILLVELTAGDGESVLLTTTVDNLQLYSED